jgi:hypothetical protein
VGDNEASVARRAASVYSDLPATANAATSEKMTSALTPAAGVGEDDLGRALSAQGAEQGKVGHHKQQVRHMRRFDVAQMLQC